MKIRLVYLVFFGALLCLLAIASKNGRASQDKIGNTGAPGDAANLNGTPRTCTYCHFGAAAPAVTIEVLNADSTPVSNYIPGQQYIARVRIVHPDTTLKGFGFQMIALRDSGNTDLDGFIDPGNNTVNNYKLATIPNGRTYAEHDNVSVNHNRFSVIWTAPAAGTGPVTFYAAGNAVNRNGSTSGDGAASAILHLPEAMPLASGDPVAPVLDLRVWPNPVGETAQVDLFLYHAGRYRFTLYDASARVVWAAEQQLGIGENRVSLPAETWAPGVHFLEVAGERGLKGAVLVKE